ncbi:hypothetical protein P5V15_009080 [Pogonomyrmex californicus]
MRIAMLVPAIRRSTSCSLRRIAACITYRDKTRSKLAQSCNESNLLSASLQSFAARRIYCTDSENDFNLPTLVDGVKVFLPSLTDTFHMLYLTFMKVPSIDKEFLLSETLEGIKHAITVISQALAKEDYDSLDGLVTDDMIETLRAKISTFNSAQKRLIAVNEEDGFVVLCDMAVHTTGEEHSIEVKAICQYIPGFGNEKKTDMMSVTQFFQRGKFLVCNYTFVRKYVNNVGGPWIATFVNHYSINP